MRKDLIKILHEMQKWRRGADIPMPSPKEFGEAIDDCIRILRRLSDEQVKGILNGENKGL